MLSGPKEATFLLAEDSDGFVGRAVGESRLKTQHLPYSRHRPKGKRLSSLSMIRAFGFITFTPGREFSNSHLLHNVLTHALLCEHCEMPFKEKSLTGFQGKEINLTEAFTIATLTVYFIHWYGYWSRIFMQSYLAYIIQRSWPKPLGTNECENHFRLLIFSSHSITVVSGSHSKLHPQIRRNAVAGASCRISYPQIKLHREYYSTPSSIDACSS